MKRFVALVLVVLMLSTLGLSVFARNYIVSPEPKPQPNPDKPTEPTSPKTGYELAGIAALVVVSVVGSAYAFKKFENA